MAEDMDIDIGAVAPAADKGKAPMTNGTAAHASKGYELPWVRRPRRPAAHGSSWCLSAHEAAVSACVVKLLHPGHSQQLLSSGMDRQMLAW